MVVAKTTTTSSKQRGNDVVPMIDLSWEREKSSIQIVKACEEFGFFKVMNHGVGDEVVRKMEEKSSGFFAEPAVHKEKKGPANPYGYGSKNIGFNGDFGELEYLILNANDHSSIDHVSKSISNDDDDDRFDFSFVVKQYVEQVRELASKILELMAEGLNLRDKSVFSKLINNVESDSILRLNHYPPMLIKTNGDDDSVGFGEHTDPQMLTILRSNGVDGLQISLEDGVWVPISPQPISAFFVNVGDTLQALTNGRFKSVRHRVMLSSKKPRMSMAYFGAPATDAIISPPPELVTSQFRRLYRPFTWDEYKKATYSRRLGDNRLRLFHQQQQLDDCNNNEILI